MNEWMVWQDDWKDNHHTCCVLGSLGKIFPDKENSIFKWCRDAWKNMTSLWNDKIFRLLEQKVCAEEDAMKWGRKPSWGQYAKCLKSMLRCLYFILKEIERQGRLLIKEYQTFTCIYWEPSICQTCSRLSFIATKKQAMIPDFMKLISQMGDDRQ